MLVLHQIHRYTRVVLLLPLFLFTGLSGIVNAQSYTHFIDSASVWFQVNCFDCAAGESPHGFYKKYFIGDDTTYNGYTYNKLHYISQYWHTVFEEPFYFGHPEYGSIVDETDKIYVREDTLLKKVYYLDLADDSIERILVDFNFAVGDTLTFGSYMGQINTISSVGEIMTSSGYRKQFTIMNEGSIEIGYLVEGIGTNFGLFANVIEPFEDGETLLCFMYNNESNAFAGTGITINNPETECDFFEPTDVDDIEYQSELAAYPNPSTDQIVINNSTEQFGNFFYSIYNLSGILLLSGENLNRDEFEINIEELHSGYYILILNSDNKSWRGSFIKE